MAEILVSGFTGGIGRATAKALSEEGHKVTALVRDVTKAEKYKIGLENITLVEGDASSYEQVKRAAQGCTHLVYGLNIPYDKWETDAVTLLETSLKVAAESKLKFVFPGNVYNFGHAQTNPVSETHPHNAFTKKGKIREKMETMIKNYSAEYGFPYAIVRMPDFYGPYVVNGFSENLFRSAIAGKSMMWIGDKNVKTEYIFIEDGGKAMAIATISDKGNNEEFNIPAYSPVKTDEFIEKISKSGGKSSKPQILNSNLVFAIMGLINPVVKEVKEMLYLKREELILDGTKFRETFGTLPATPYDEGIAKTFQWVKEFYNY